MHTRACAPQRENKQVAIHCQAGSTAAVVVYLIRGGTMPHTHSRTQHAKQKKKGQLLCFNRVYIYVIGMMHGTPCSSYGMCMPQCTALVAAAVDNTTQLQHTHGTRGGTNCSLLRMKVVGACIATAAALDCASAFVAPVASSSFAASSALSRSSSPAARAGRVPGLCMSAVSTDAKVSPESKKEGSSANRTMRHMQVA